MNENLCKYLMCKEKSLTYCRQDWLLQEQNDSRLFKISKFAQTYLGQKDSSIMCESHFTFYVWCTWSYWKFPCRHVLIKKVSFSEVCSYLHTYLLTPWSGVLLEKLTSFQLVKKFPIFYGAWNFITTFTCPYPEFQVRGFLYEHFRTRYIFMVSCC